MKAIIPVAGVGTRLRPHTYTQPKPLIPVAGKPLIGSIIDQLVEDVGVTDFVFILGYLGDKIRHFIETHYSHLNIEYVYQEERKGLGHALWVASSKFIESEEILIVLGDTIFETDLKAFVEQPFSSLGVMKVENPSEFGVAEINDDGSIRRLVEKPKIPKSNMALVGLYRIIEVDIFIESLNYIIDNEMKTIGEFQLTDALMQMVQMGTEIRTFEVDNWFDCGKKDILLATNSVLLKRRKWADIPNNKFENTIIVPPVSIGEGCQIKHSIIGPNVTIGDNAKVNYAIVRDSIIGNFAQLEEVVLHKSIIGSDASIKGLNQSLNIGDNTEIDFS